jgi:hypothetical protein
MFGRACRKQGHQSLHHSTYIVTNRATRSETACYFVEDDADRSATLRQQPQTEWNVDRAPAECVWNVLNHDSTRWQLL